MDYLDSVKIRALASVMDPDHEAFLQTIFEWYSKEYHTPLHVVFELPLDQILYAYYRSIYRAMEADERHNEAIYLLESPEERKAREEANKKDDEEFIRRAAAHNAKKKSGDKTASKAEAILRKMRDKAAAAVENGDGLTKTPSAKPLPIKPMPEVTLPEPDGEEVTVTYMSDADFEAEIDKPLALPPRKKP